jgi:glutamate racemase
VPIIGVIEPGAIDALSVSKNKKIGVIGTSTTIKSQSYKNHIIKRVPDAKVFSESCPLLVPLAEEGWLKHKATLQIIGEYLAPLKKKDIDTLILGCTHYPLLKDAIRKIMGDGVALIDSAISTTKAAKSLLAEEGLIDDNRLTGRQACLPAGRHKFFVSDEPERFRRIGERFLGKRLNGVKKVEYGL